MKQTIKTRHEAPLAPELVDELLSFWKKIFGFDPDLTQEVWLGSETQYHRLQLYLARHKGRCVGSTVTITPHAFPGLGAVAQVATRESRRNFAGKPFRTFVKTMAEPCSLAPTIPRQPASIIGWVGKISQARMRW
tara:strand:- start:2002 stop:2406 length:405 start_codon:yes stop_codon:yes gene_type:complete